MTLRPDRIGSQPELGGFHSVEGLEAYTRDLEYLSELAQEATQLPVGGAVVAAKLAALLPVLESVLHAYAQDGSFPGSTATRIEKWRRSR